MSRKGIVVILLVGAVVVVALVATRTRPTGQPLLGAEDAIAPPSSVEGDVLQAPSERLPIQEPVQAQSGASLAADAPGAPVSTTDPAGVSDERRLQLLVELHDQMSAMLVNDAYGAQSKTTAELLFVTRCVAAILHESHRAESQPTMQDLSLKPAEDEFAFACDGAVYRFRRGEFPAYDAVYDQVARSELTALERPADLDAQVQALYDQALVSFGLPPNQGR